MNVSPFDINIEGSLISRIYMVFDLLFNEKKVAKSLIMPVLDARYIDINDVVVGETVTNNIVHARVLSLLEHSTPPRKLAKNLPKEKLYFENLNISGFKFNLSLNAHGASLTHSLTSLLTHSLTHSLRCGSDDQQHLTRPELQQLHARHHHGYVQYTPLGED